MAYFDVFNGDADGICALQQLRLARPLESELVTGVKRDIKLLERVPAKSGDYVTTLDISLDKNREALEALLERDVAVLYIDHHFAGNIPDHPSLEAVIDTAPEVCTALLVNDRLGGKFLPWAVVAAFGDNLFDSARRAAAPLGLDETQSEELQSLGLYINYNAYGESVEDLHFHPADLYRKIQPYENPFAFIREEEAYRRLREGYEEDMANARAVSPEIETDTHAVYILPDAAWSRRVSGVFGNEMARQHPQRAHALLTRKSHGGYVVSVRSPLANKVGADDLCRSFPTGGGRKAAAGINHLPQEELDEFVDRFHRAFP
jgi:single-stranded DNA-specific DHH superfamily exonuclease